MSIRLRLACHLFAVVCFLAMPALAQAIAVSATAPVGNANNVARAAAVTIDFDRPLDTSSITGSTFRVWGTQSGPAAGTTAYSNGNATLTFTPSHAFFPGEWVSIQMSHSIAGADASPMRAAGYAFQFQTATAPAAITFTQNGPDVSVRSNPNDPTRLYGGAITDINHDGWIDFIAINEVSGDLRVLLNTADGSGLLGPGADAARADRPGGEPERGRRLQQRRLHGRGDRQRDEQHDQHRARRRHRSFHLGAEHRCAGTAARDRRARRRRRCRSRHRRRVGERRAADALSQRRQRRVRRRHRFRARGQRCEVRARGRRHERRRHHRSRRGHVVLQQDPRPDRERRRHVHRDRKHRQRRLFLEAHARRRQQ